MDKIILEELYKKAEGIARETADKLAVYNRGIAELFYGTHPVDFDPEDIKGEGAEQAKEIAVRFQKFQEQSIAKVTYAPADKMAQVREMKAIINEGNEKIKDLYASGLKQ